MSPVFEHFLIPTSPVFALWIGACLLILMECFLGPSMRIVKVVTAIATTAISLGLVWYLWHRGLAPISDLQNAPRWMHEFTLSYRLDPISLGLYAGVALFTVIALVFISLQFATSVVLGEILILVLFIASGMMLLVSADSLLMAFLSLELLSLPTYVLVGVHRKDKQSAEAALKYFLFGSLASVILVFGIALLYAQFGTMHLSQIAAMLDKPAMATPYSRSLLVAGLCLVMISVGFKVGIVPFHMWLPDVYQGAPSSITGFMGSAIKLAGFGLALRLFWGMFLPLIGEWAPILSILAVMTMFVGNIAALVQDNLKRMFAYSSISHAGYLLLGIASASRSNPNSWSIYYYLIVYGIMFLGLFAVIAMIEDATDSTEIYEISGLGFSHPFLGACLGIFALSAAGIPPTAGFVAKYFVFFDAVRSGNTAYVVLAVISSLIGVYYYLRVIVYLYMKENKEKLVLDESHRFALACIMLCAASMIFLALSPGTLGLGSAMTGAIPR